MNSTKPIIRKTILLSMVFVSASAILPARAQSTGDTANAGMALEEITVTARKREESLQNVPVAVTAVTGDFIDKTGIRSMDQLAQSTPSLFFTSVGGGQSQPQIAMRGNSSRNATANDVATGVFTDGVYTTAYSQLMHGPVDVARVEVLAGPQGTVYGRNTIAGAINMITNDPTETFEASVKAGFGQGAEWDDNLWSAGAMLSGPLTDTLSARVVYSHKERDGYLYDPTSGTQLGNLESDYARGKLLWRAGDDLDVEFTLEYAKDSRPRYDSLIYIEGGRHPYTTLPLSQIFFPGRSGSIWEVRTDMKPTSESTMVRGYVQVDWRTAIGTLTSLTSYGTSRLDQLSDNDNTDYSVWRTTIFDYKASNWSEELRLAGSAGRWSWLAGLYYLDDDMERNNFTFEFGPYSSAFIGGLDGQYFDNEQTTKSYAGFGQVDFGLTSKLTATLGARWSRDEKTSPYSYFQRTTAGVVTGAFTIVREAEWDSTTGLASLKYQWNDDLMTYASYSSGFKAGGFQATPNAVVSMQYFDPEEVNQIEIGVKSMWFDRRLRANIAAYQLDYSDLQINNARTINNVNFQLTGNAAGADVSGADVELSGLLTSNLTLGLRYTWLPTAKIKGFSTIAGFPNIEGFRLPRSPEHSFTASLDYRFEALGGEFGIGSEYVYRDSFVNELDATLNPDGSFYTVPLPSYGLVNLRAEYTRDAWSVNAYVRNAANKAYFAGAAGAGAGGATPFGAVGEPRTWEISLERRF